MKVMKYLGGLKSLTFISVSLGLAFAPLLSVLLGESAQALTQPDFSEYSIPADVGSAYAITGSTDGNSWMTFPDSNKIGKMSQSGVLTTYQVNAPQKVGSIVSGYDFLHWFTLTAVDGTSPGAIGSITLTGTINIYPLPAGHSPIVSPNTGIGISNDKSLWFPISVDNGQHALIGRMTTSGVLTEYPYPSEYPNISGVIYGMGGGYMMVLETAGLPGSTGPAMAQVDFSNGAVTRYPYPAAAGTNVGPESVIVGDANTTLRYNTLDRFGRLGTFTHSTLNAAGVYGTFKQTNGKASLVHGMDDNVYYAVPSTGKIGRYSPEFNTVNEFNIPSADIYAFHDGIGPDGRIWFSEKNTRKIGAFTYPVSDAPNLTVAKTVSNSAALSWNATPETRSYYVYRDGSRIANPTGTTFTDSAASNATHTYTVRSYSGFRESPASNTVTVLIDRIAPVITGTPDRPPNANGWYNANVTVTWSVTDPAPSSGTPTTPPPITVTGEGNPVNVVSAPSCDPAGNCPTKTLPLKIDKIIPGISYTLSTPPNTNGWQNGDVTVTFNCFDAQSGIDTCTAPVTLGEGANQTVTGTVTDKAGNSRSTSVTLNIDKGKPTIAYSVSPTPSASGWSKSNAVVTFTCMDNLSGINSCTGPQTVSTETSGQTVSGTATDKAGNSQSTSVVVKLDKTDPTLNYTVSSPANSNGWNKQDVTVTFNCADNLSGYVNCPDPVTVSDGQNQVISRSVSDDAGNTKSVNLTLNVDKGLPTITSNVTPGANAAGWHSADTTVTFTCTDTLSGIDNCTAAQTVSGDTDGTVVTGQALDKAGNVQTATEIIKVDKTDPTISYTLSQNPNGAGWNNATTTVTFTCDDNLSGVAECAQPVVLEEGADQTVTGTVTDVAGNTKSIALTLNVDQTAPTITSVVSPAPNAAGWYKSDVSIGFNCEDLLSGVASCSDPQTVSTETASQVVTGTATDVAGNSASASETIKLDKTNPTIAYNLSGTPNANGWNKEDVTVSFDCDDNLSGVANCTAPITLGEGANQTVVGNVTDVAGNTNSVSLMVSVDKGLPTIISSISPAANVLGWHNSNVTISYTCDDNLSGIDSCTNPQTITGETDGLLVSGTAIDKADNTQSASDTIKLDKTAPTIDYAISESPNASNWHKQEVTVTFTCDDNLSGIATCPAPITVAEGEDQTISSTAIDNAGNTKTVSATLNVDKTAPTITTEVSPTANAAGWYKSDVTVDFTCSDLLSGIATCPDQQVVNTETASQVVAGTATDVAGNTASASETIKLDKTNPTISYSLSETPNANGWNKNNVTVTFNCVDSLSGVDECSAPVTLGEGANQTVIGNVTDVAGNVNSLSLTLSIDKGLPTIISSISPAANVAGWHSGNTTVSYTCDDNLSGIDSCTSPQTITGDTGGITVSGTAIDKAGNEQSVSDTIKLDKTAPSINYSLSLAPNVNNWHKQDVTVTFTCDDSLSGVASCSAPVTVSEGEAQAVTGTAVDVAGNTKAVTATLNVDKTLPTISALPLSSPNAAGWYKDDVIVGFNCADLLSGVDSCTDNQTVSTEGNNQVSGTVVDKASNSVSTTTTIKLDKTRPTISYSLSTPANANGWNNSSVTVNFGCTDSLSLVASCSSPVTVGEGANQIVTGTAVDNAGNVQTVEVVVSVDSGKPTISYTINPVPNAAGWNKSNATVHFVCNDGLSQIDTCTTDQLVGTNTAGQNVTGTAVDRAGNSQSVTANVKLDKTAPTATNPTVSSGGLFNLNANRTFSMTIGDNLSGVVRAEYYIDTVSDPGFGNAITMTINGNTATATYNNVPNGGHNAIMRTLDAAGNWSSNTSVHYQRGLFE